MTEFDFLPDKLDLNGKEWNEIIESVYSVFEKDFKKHKTTHFDTEVEFDRKILDDGSHKEEGFWHIVEKENKSVDERQFDTERAQRLPWIRPALEADDKDEVIIFDFDHGSKSKGIRRYVWLKELNYVTILQPKDEIFFLVTAFYIDSSWKRKDLEKKYNKRLGS